MREITRQQYPKGTFSSSGRKWGGGGSELSLGNKKGGGEGWCGSTLWGLPNAFLKTKTQLWCLTPPPRASGNFRRLN